MKTVSQKEQRIFNTPIDLGLRSLFLLAQTKKRYDLQTLVYLDYFLVHSADITGGPTSLHPNAPFRAGEILVRRKLMKDGLHIMHLKQLIDVVLEDGGIYYTRNKLTKSFLKHYSSEYAAQLQKRAQWVNRKFGKYDEAKLKKFVDTNLEKWGAEFMRTVESNR